MRRKPSNRTPAVFSPSSFMPQDLYQGAVSVFGEILKFDQIVCISSSCTVVSKTSISAQYDPHSSFQENIYTEDD